MPEIKSEIKIANAWICQVNNRSLQPVFGDLHIEAGKISKIQQKNFQDFVDHPDRAPDKALNAGGRVLTLPLVNFHDHLYSRLAKGLATRGPMDNFQQVLENLWWKLDRALDIDMIQACGHMGALESIRQGVTYIFDHHASPLFTKKSLTVLGEVFKQHGLRGVFCFETSDRNGNDLAQQALDENLSFYKEQSDSDLKAMMGLHASFTLKNETLAKAGDLIRQLDMGIHIHLCEDRLDEAKSLELYGLSPVERLEKFKLLNPRSILSHGIYLQKADYRVISEHGCAIAYNPDSNLNNSVGLPTFTQVPDKIPVLIGTDGMHANIARSMKQLFLLYRHQKNSFGEVFQWIEKIYFDQLEFIRSYFPDYPLLKQGDRADLIIWDYVPPTPFSADNFWGHYLYGVLERPVHSVMQSGRFLMKNHQIPVEEDGNVFLDIYRQGARLFEAFKEQ